MMETNDNREGTATNAEVERIVAAGPSGAIALATVTTVIVFAIWFAFYFLIFLPRGTIS
ncbi:hypothetical protein [Paraburkholderia adhaesiva]|uniref:hypothetical protein n=1 Tax=Paraburkholderia adhaesiva TaxID=2883244 RepID=UPI001F173C8A|nr:hypothetical protein [Paraburkholderia adhaesiva]